MNRVVPGLLHIPAFFNNVECKALSRSSFHMIRQARQAAGKIPMSEEKPIPNPNFPSPRIYKQVALAQESGHTIHGQYFDDRYSSKGHDLVYFITNSNVPDYFASYQKRLLSLLVQHQLMPAVPELHEEIRWKAVINAYEPNPLQPPEFAWHIDVAINGEVTAILSLGEDAVLNMRPPPFDEDPSSWYSQVLKDGSLIVLSGDARWKWQHRVVAPTGMRYSLVLGAKL
jgi:alkylated DNA repair dioxygenase AlkB